MFGYLIGGYRYLGDHIVIWRSYYILSNEHIDLADEGAFHLT